MTALPFRLRHLAAMGACAGAVLAAPLLAAPSALADTTDNYSCTHSPQTSTVPAGDNEAIVSLWGADGGSATNDSVTSSGGNGERLVADVPVTAGSTLDVIVGCQGGSVNGGNGAPGGYGGGGRGGNGDSGADGSLSGAGGGGASYILPHGGAFSTLYAIAGGGGGAGNTGGYLPGPNDGAGGAGGNAETDGGNGGADTSSIDPGPGGQGGASGNNGGAGGASPVGSLRDGGNGSAGQGGNGGDYDSYDGGAGGGGGGGLVGGGGGGYGGDGNQDGPGGGGGGGGQGGVQNGATLVSAMDSANAGDGVVSITYTVAAHISVNPSSKDFGTVTVGQFDTNTLTITNSGEAPLNIGQASLTGADAGQFGIVSGRDTCSGQTVTGGGTCTIAVAFTPTRAGSPTATLSVPSNDSSGPATVLLSGSGQLPASPPAPTPTPNPPASNPGQTPPAPAPKLVERLTAVGTPTTQQLFTHGEKVQVHCSQACKVTVALEVYHRAAARGNHYRGLLHAQIAVEPWTRMTVSETVLTMSQAGTRTVYLKLTQSAKHALSYAGSILLGVYTTPTGEHGSVSKRWVKVSGPDMNAKVSAQQHGD